VSTTRIYVPPVPNI